MINLALLLMGIGAGTLLSEIIVQAGMEESVARPGTIFLMAGVGLFLGFVLTKKLNKDS